MEIKNLSGVVLVTVEGADLRGADLYGADLEDAYLHDANLYAADLRGADLYGADLEDAYLRGAKINWQSHDLMAEILRQAAGECPAKRSIAGLVLVSRDWCWEKFLTVEHPEREWAIGVLAALGAPNLSVAA